MICQNCKSEHADTALFCGGCGEMTPPPTEVEVNNLKLYMQNSSSEGPNSQVDAEMAPTVTPLSFTGWWRVCIAYLVQGPVKNCLLSLRTNFDNALSAWKEPNQRDPQLDPLRISETEADQSAVYRRSKFFQHVSTRSELPQSRDEAIAASRLEIESLSHTVADAQSRIAQLENNIDSIVEDHI